MTRIIDSLADISASYDALLCDLWGCLHNGVEAFPDAVAALQQFRATGGKVLLLTNSPRPATEVMRQLDQLGAPRDSYDAVASSGDSAQAAMLAGVVGRCVYHLGPERDLPFFDEIAPDIPGRRDIVRVPLDDAEGVVCTGLFDDTTETPENYRTMLLHARARGLKLLCANPDIVVDRGDKRVYCAGALAQLYSEMGGESLYFGKPHPPIYDLARSRLAALRPVTDDRILAIGDGPATDIAGAIAENLDSLFISGGLAAEATGTQRDPDPARLRTYLRTEKLSPTYTIGLLR